MANFDPPRIFDGAVASEQVGVNRFIANVFSWMVAGLAVTALTAWYFAASGAIAAFYTETGMSALGWLVMLAPIGFILAMNLGFQRWSTSAITLLFFAFSIVMGMSLSSIFIVYTTSSLFQVFMAVVGYTTSTDLTRFGSLLGMALIGILIASLVNIWLGSSGLDFIISILGVLIFTGLIAYDTQKLKRIGQGVEYGTAPATKLAILGATSLYLDFINLFLFLLRLFGGKRE